MRLILASASQRRQELLKRITEKFEIIVSNYDEESVKFEGSCSEYVMKLAEGKALDIANTLDGEGIIIGCDTIVSYEDNVLGKPKDEDDAFNMLKILSGKTHEVYSGIAIVHMPTKKIITDFVCTEVVFSTITDEEIIKYIKTEEPMDKAGAYGIQGYGGVFVERIDGCYYNVVGLPINRLNKMLKGIGVNL